MATNLYMLGRYGLRAMFQESGFSYLTSTVKKKVHHAI
jgi:hypothetical protein